jgi:acyl-CoA thioester hydrolase
MKRVVTTELEVRWGECDAAGIVYHPNYIDWFSVARMHFLKDNGISYMETFHNNQIVLVVLDVHCQYKKTLRAEDQIYVEARMVHLSRTRIRMEYEVLDASGSVCAMGHTEHAYVDAANRAINVAKRAPLLWERLSELPHDNESTRT